MAGCREEKGGSLSQGLLHMGSSQRAIFVCESPSFLYTFVLNIVAVAVSYLIPVSSKFFLFQFMIPAFCPTHWKR